MKINRKEGCMLLWRVCYIEQKKAVDSAPFKGIYVSEVTKYKPEIRLISCQLNQGQKLNVSCSTPSSSRLIFLRWQLIMSAMIKKALHQPMTAEWYNSSCELKIKAPLGDTIRLQKLFLYTRRIFGGCFLTVRGRDKWSGHKRAMANNWAIPRSYLSAL